MERCDFIKVSIEREENVLDNYQDVSYAFNKFFLAKDKESGKYGLINIKGEVIIPFEYEKKDFRNIIREKQYKESNDLILVKQDGMCGYKGLDGKILIDIKYQKGLPFREELAGVKIENYWGFIDKNDNLHIPFMYLDVKPFSENLAPVKLNNKWGYINKDNEVILPFIYDDASIFIDGTSLVKKDEEYHFIDKLGNELTNTISKTLYIKDESEIPNDAKKIKILEYLTIFELDEETVIIQDENLENFIKSVLEVEKKLLENKIILKRVVKK